MVPRVRVSSLCLLALAGGLQAAAAGTFAGPLRFEATATGDGFLANGERYRVLATPRDTRLELEGPGGQEVSWRFVAAAAARFVPGELLPSRSHYLLGSDPAGWRTDVAHFARLRAAALYPGVDLVLRGDDGELAFDLELAPGADLAAIQLAWSGQQALRVLPSGEVEVALADGALALSPPLVWEVNGETRRQLPARFALVAADTLGFVVEGRDPAAHLVIDPTLSWATFLGGTGDETVSAMAVASDGGLLVAGSTTATNFPTAAALRPTSGGGTDGYIAKLTADGQDLVFATYLGGSGADVVEGLVVDASGNVVVAGQTTSSNFPTKSAFQSTRRGNRDAFVAKLTPSGAALVFSTYFGSADCGVCGGLTDGKAVAVDGSGNVLLAGATFGSDFPGTAGTLRPAFARSCNASNPDSCLNGIGGFDADGFVAKFSASGARLWATLFGGAAYGEYVTALAADAAGNVYLGGDSGSSDFPTTAGAFINSASSFAAPFVSKLNPTASQLVYSTFLDDGRQPALASSQVRGLVVDSSGRVTAVGYTQSHDFPTTPGALQAPPVPPPAFSVPTGFVTRLNAGGTAQLASTLLGGQAAGNEVQAVFLRADGRTLVGGRDSTRSVPAVGLPAATGTAFGYVAELEPDFTTLTMAGMLANTERVDAVVASGENVYVAGLTKSAGLATAGSFDTTFAGPSDAFVAEIAPGPPPTCIGDATHLCLANDRFRIAVDWQVASQGLAGEGKAVELTGDTGYFWFFNAANVELVLKVLDGRGVNGSWWVFYGALSDVAYTITVTDTSNGAEKTYTNPRGNLASVADVTALPGGGAGLIAQTGAFSLTTGQPADADELAELSELLGASIAAEGGLAAAVDLASQVGNSAAGQVAPIAYGRVDRAAAAPPRASNEPAFVPATSGNGSPVGSTYEIEAMLAEDITGDGLGELFHTCPGSGDYVVTFNASAENLPAYSCAQNTTPRVTETFTDHGDGTATVAIRVASTNGSDLFPGGLVSGSTPVNGAGLRIGFFTGSDPLDWTPEHRVLAASLDLRANGSSVFTGGAPNTLDVAAFFGAPDPWDGNFGIYYANRAGDGIDEILLDLTVEHGEPPPPPACVADATHLCLAGDRFRVSVAWRTPQGATGAGRAVELTADTGYFWFFQATNVELVLKILDGRPVNDFWWVFYGALSNVQYTITVEDTASGQIKTYSNPQGTLASVGDVRALP